MQISALDFSGWILEMLFFLYIDVFNFIIFIADYSI